MPTTTTTYSFNKPVVGADEDDWGGYLNGNWDSVDDLLDGTTPVTGIDINSGTLDGVTIGGTTAGAGTFTTLTANTSITGTLATAAQTNITSVGTLTSLTVSGDVSFGDNDKAIFGAGSDLQIYHDGSNSRIADQGVGGLILQGDAGVYVKSSDNTETMAQFVKDGQVSLWYDNVSKLATTSTGIDVTGTVTADGLTVEGAGASLANFYRSSANANFDAITFKDTTNTNTNAKIGWNANELRLDGTSSIRLVTDAKNRLLVSSGGDISFYEDTGTTAKFFWDASAESLGIGTSSPFAGITVGQESSGGNLTLAALYATGTATGGNAAELNIIASSDNINLKTKAGDSLSFTTNNSGSEAMLIDSSGNLLVGTTSTDLINNNGIVAAAAGYLDVGRNSLVARFTRRSTDGSIVEFRKDGTTVGSIGVYSGDITVGNGNAGLIFNDAVGLISPWDMTANAVEDNAIDLGYSAGRFKDLYLSGGLRGDTLTFSSLAGSERMRIDSSGNVIVSKTATSWNTEGIVLFSDASASGSRIDVTTDGGTPVNLNRLTSDGEIAGFYKDGITVGSIYNGGSNLGINSSGGLLLVDDIITPTSANDATYDIGRSLARYKDLYLSGGVYLGGTGAANKLDDYEEGTWTPTLLGVTGITYQDQIGSYTKIGNFVHLSFQLRATWTASGLSYIGGIPFTSRYNFNDYGAGGFFTVQQPESSTVRASMFIQPNSSSITLYEIDGHTQWALPSATQNYLNGNVFYRV